MSIDVSFAENCHTVSNEIIRNNDIVVCVDSFSKVQIFNIICTDFPLGKHTTVKPLGKQCVPER